jgi:AcrR family transcriptional regulator
MLDAAARLFGTQRFHQVRMEDIAAAAAVGKGTLYRYFNDKEELYQALLDRASRQLLARLDAELGHPDGPRQRLLRVVATLLDFFGEQPHLFALIQRAEVLQGPGFPWQQTRRQLIRIVKSLFEEGKQSGEFAIGDPELYTLLLLGGLRTVIRFGKEPRRRGLPAEIVEVFLRSSAPPARR